MVIDHGHSELEDSRDDLGGSDGQRRSRTSRRTEPCQDSRPEVGLVGDTHDRVCAHIVVGDVSGRVVLQNRQHPFHLPDVLAGESSISKVDVLRETPGTVGDDGEGGIEG